MKINERIINYAKKASKIVAATTVMSFMIISSVFAEGEKLSLEEAIKIARTNFTFNADSLKFDSDFYESEQEDGENSVWSLAWRNESTYDEYVIEVDALTKEIKSYNHYRNSIGNKYSKISKYSVQEGKNAALNFINKIVPEKANMIKFNEKSKNNELASTYETSYTYTFYRIIGDIPFFDDYVQVDVDRDTLEITSFYQNWNNKEIKVITPTLTQDDIKKIIDSKVGIELVYKKENKKEENVNKIIIKPSDNEKEVKVRLVYVLKNYNMQIDAVTGEVLKNSYYTNTARNMGMVAKNEASMALADEVAEVELTENELKEVNDMIKLMTKDDATKKAYEYIEKSYNLQSANISKSNDKYIWSLNFNKKTKDKYAGSAYAKINASTGEIISFNINSYDDTYNKTPKYTYEKSKSIADRFVTKIQPEKIKEIVLLEDDDKETKNMYYFTYARTYNGIKTDFNSINVTVDGITGKVIRYSLTWYDFEDTSKISKEEAIKVQDAYNALYEKSPLELRYVTFYNNDKPEIRLVYCLEESDVKVIDAVTSKCLDANLKEIKDINSDVFTDLVGHWAESTVRLLNNYGVIKSEEKFNPSSVATQKEVIKMLVNGLYSSNVYDGMTDDEYYKQAIRKEIITEEEKDYDKELTRIEVARLVVCALGYKEIAIPTSKNYDYSMYVSKYNDVTKEDRGTTSIVNTFNIMKGNGRIFSPNVNITKAEVATVILNMMNR